MKKYTLEIRGKTKTPVIIKNPKKFYIKQCRGTFVKYRVRAYNKITKNVPQIPYSWFGYMGELELKYKSKTRTQAEKKLDEILLIKQIGKYSKNGLGLIEWLDADIKQICNERKWIKPRYRMKIRKGLPHHLPKHIKDLVKYGLLHDFFRCENERGTNYPSKIHVEPDLDDKELVRLIKLSHLKTDHPLVNAFKPYDHLAAYITRKKKSERKTRLNWLASKLNREVDFHKLAEEISQVVNTKNVNQLYEFIYNSQELRYLNEAMEYGHTSLRTHLLIITNLIVSDYQRGELHEFNSQLLR